MPTYQYQCRDCGNGFEQFQKFSEDPLTVCPACGGTVQRVIQNVGVVFKGSGWYINDSRKSGEKSSSASSAPASDASKAPDGTPAKADAPKSDSPKAETTKAAPTAAAD